jgi:tripartite-type tricarboxylate transporter receptor subunit TctC
MACTRSRTGTGSSPRWSRHDWKKDLQENFWDDGYADAKSTRRRLDHEYAEYKAILTELGVAK